MLWLTTTLPAFTLVLSFIVILLCAGAGLTSRRVVIRDQSAGFHFGFEFHSDSPLCWNLANGPVRCG
jgi:hypothetical protein